MPHALRPLAALALGALALTASAARAEPVASPLELRARTAAGPLHYASPDPPAVRANTGLAISEHLLGLQLWAAGVRYAVGGRAAGYGLGAGAALPIHEHLSLTAGYRITGYSGGALLDRDGELVDEQVDGAYLGLAFEF